MQNGVKFRCYPNKAQEQTLLQGTGLQRYIYNAKVREDLYFRCFARKLLQLAGQFAPVTDQATGEIFHPLRVGTKKHPIGMLEFKAHMPCGIPASIHICIYAGHGHVSLNDENGMLEPCEKETIDGVRPLEENELRKMTVGLDRSITLPLAGNNRQKLGFTPVQKARWGRQESHKKRWQRRTQSSARWVKARSWVARYQWYSAEVYREVTCQITYRLFVDPRYKLFVFEALKVKNMWARAQLKQNQQESWIKNCAAAKSGLTLSILASMWGQKKTYLQYKARCQGKLAIDVPPFYFSQECAVCGYVHHDHLVSQSEFVCSSCGNTDRADHIAAKVIVMRGARQFLDGKYSQNEKKRCGITR